MLPEIFLKAVIQQFSGILNIDAKDCTKLIYFRNGNAVFVESNSREETLGQFLITKKLIDAKSLEDALQELSSQRELKLGEILVKRGLIAPNSLMEQLQLHQEEKLLNAFELKEGEVRVVNNTQWPAYVSAFPIKTLKVFFAAIEKHMSVEEIEQASSICEFSLVQLKHLPSQDFTLPPSALRVLKTITRDRIRVDQFSDKLFLEMDQIIQYLYFFKLADWIEVQASQKTDLPPAYHSEDFSQEISSDIPTGVKPKLTQPEQQKSAVKMEVPKEALSQEQQMVEKKGLSPFMIERMEVDYKKLGSINFYQMFNLTPEYTLQQLQVKFFQVVAEYKKYEEHEKGREIVSWIKTAYDVLKDPKLRLMYDRRFAFRKHSANVELGEREFYKALRMIEADRFEEALNLLIKVNERAQDSTFKAYHAYVLFKMDPRKNIQDAGNMVNDAFGFYAADPFAHYIAGCIQQSQKNFSKAEGHFRSALQVYPTYQDVILALEKLRFEATKERHIEKKEKKEKSKNEKPGFFDLSVGGFKIGGNKD